MPIKQAAFKHVRQSKKHATRNKQVRSHLHSIFKRIEKDLDAQKFDAVEEKLRQAIKAIDKAQQQGVLKGNTAARKKSRLIRRVRAGRQQKAS